MRIRNDTQIAWVSSIVLMVSVAANAQDCSIPFEATWVGYATGEYPQDAPPFTTAVSDLNGDGLLDLAVVGQSLSILFGDGEGGYRDPQTYPVLSYSYGITTNDFDNDGDVDVVITDSGGKFLDGTTVSYYRNVGTGGLVLIGNFSAGTNGPAGITAADFDGDGFLDVAVAHDEYIQYGNSAAVLLNNGGNGFHNPTLINLTSGTREIDSGDIDGDGDPDLIVAHETNRATVLRNDNGSFVVAQTVTGIDSTTGEKPSAHLADIDHDGDLDLFYSNEGSESNFLGATGLFRNQGNGTFVSPEILEFSSPGNGGCHVNTADINGDGWLDVMAVSNYPGAWFAFLGDGTGGLLPSVGYRVGQEPRHLQAGDLDQDGDLDVTVLAYDSIQACVFENPGDGEFPILPVFEMSDLFTDPVNMQVGDIDGDGDLDIVGKGRDSGAHHLAVHRNNGDGTFAPRENYVSSGWFPLHLQLQDMDSDGHLDVLILDTEGRFRIRYNDGTGGFSTLRSYRNLSGSYANRIRVADLDNDGDLDVSADDLFTVDTSMNLGNRDFGPPISHNPSDTPNAFEFGDFNEDSLPDLLTDTGLQQTAELSLGLGNGRFDSPIPAVTEFRVQALGVADVDGDGHLDFGAFYLDDEKGLSIRRGRGDGSFFLIQNTRGAYWAGDHTSSLDFADLDGDGLIDAVTANYRSQDISFWKGNGDGTFEPTLRLGIGQYAWDIEVGDFDADGVIDLAVMVMAHGDFGRPGFVILRGIDRCPGPSRASGPRVSR